MGYSCFSLTLCVKSESSIHCSLIDDYDRLELVLSCLVYIANTRKYWISVDVSKNMNYQDEIENYSYIGLDFWMSHFITMLDYKNPLMGMSCSTIMIR